MFCPQCGQQQASSDMRFCSRCGLSLDSVSELLMAGGSYSAFRKGVRQGAILMIFGTLFAPVLAYILMHDRVRANFIPICMFLFFIAALVRILYALLVEGKVSRSKTHASLPYAPSLMDTQLESGKRDAALPPARGTSVADWRQQVNTAEVQPPSVVEGTTKVFDSES